MTVKTSKQYSKTSKAAVFAVLVFGVVASVAAISRFAWQKTNAPQAPEQAVLSDNDSQQTTQQQTAVLGAQTPASQDTYVIGVTSLQQKNALLQVGLTITNQSQQTLQTSPFLQFKLVSLTTNTAHTPVQPAGTVLYTGGPLAAGQSNSGTISFDAFTSNEQYELRFYTDPAVNNSYIVVPLIAATR